MRSSVTLDWVLSSVEPDHPSCIPRPAPCAAFTGRISGVGARHLGPGEVSRVVRELASPGHTHTSPLPLGLGAQGRWLLCVPWGVCTPKTVYVTRRPPFISVSAVTGNTVRRLQLAPRRTCVAAEGTLRSGAGCCSAASSIDSGPAPLSFPPDPGSGSGRPWRGRKAEAEREREAEPGELLLWLPLASGAAA